MNILIWIMQFSSLRECIPSVLLSSQKNQIKCVRKWSEHGEQGLVPFAAGVVQCKVQGRFDGIEEQNKEYNFRVRFGEIQLRIFSINLNWRINIGKLHHLEQKREGFLVGGQGSLETGLVSGTGRLVHLRGVVLPHANQNLPDCWVLLAILIVPHPCVFALFFCEKGVLGSLEHGGTVEGLAVGQPAATSVVRASFHHLEHHIESSILFISDIIFYVNYEVFEVYESVRLWLLDCLSFGSIDADAIDIREVFFLL